MILTLNQIKEHSACSPETQLFEDVFGEQMVCNKEEFIKVINSGLNFDWFILHILNPQQRKEYRDKLHTIKINYHKSIQGLNAQSAQTLTHIYQLNKIDILMSIIGE